MTQQFTASEVRNAIPCKKTRNSAMLRAFADLLEAQERAMPVAIVKDSDALYTGFLSWTGESVPPETKLYTHPPSPSDAERLAEALRELLGDIDLVKCDFCKCHTWCSVEDSRKSLIKHEAHSAQAQPSAQSKYAPPYPDQAQDPFWKVPGMVDTRPKAQPPAASVTDAMVERALSAYYVRDIDSAGFAWEDAVGDPRIAESDMRAALEAALAAQESPNG